MSQTGTRESKRRSKAAPPALKPPGSMGCIGAIAVYLGLWAVLVAATRGVPWALALGLPAVLAFVLIVVGYLYGITLLALVHWRWSRRGLRCLVVYSQSPRWEDYIRTRWLSRLEGAAITLNWSERSSWRGNLAVRVFRHFCGQQRNFNPAVVVFRGLEQPYVFRFFYAFQQAAAGRPEYLARLEAEMFKTLGADAPSSGPNGGGTG